MVKRLASIGVFAALVACGQGRALKLEIHAPCNSTALSANGVAYVELVIEAPELEAPVRATFGASDSAGQLDDVTAVSRATIEVAGRSAANDGGIGSVLVAGSLGYLDLTTANDDGYALVAGPVDTFIRTTSTTDSGLCIDQQAARMSHTASLLDDGRVLLAGGASDAGALATTEIYEPARGTYTTGPSMRSARIAHAATSLIDGSVLISGGYDGGGEPLGSLETFKNGSFGRAIAMDARAYHTATRLRDGRVFLAGGMDDSGVIASSAIYDPKNETLVDGPTLKAPRARHSAVLIDDAVVALIGGLDDTSTVTVTEFVDIDNDRSIAGPLLHQGRSDAAVQFLTAKRAIVIAGGFSGKVTDIARGTAIANIEVLQLDDEDLSGSAIACDSAQLVEPRAAAAVAVVPHGFMVVGGVSAPGEISSTAETLTFDAGACRPTVTLTTGALYASRFGAAATPLAGGDVLVTGGAAVRDGTVVSRKASEVFIVAR